VESAWKPIQDMNTRRAFGVGVVVGDQLLIFGRYDQSLPRKWRHLLKYRSVQS